MLIFLTISSLLVALIMTVVAWRAVGAERERSAARVEALAHAIHESTPVEELPLRSTAIPPPPTAQPYATAHIAANEPHASPDMFGTVAAAPATGSRWGLAVAVGAFVVASVAAMVVVFGGDTPAARTALASATDQAQAARRAGRGAARARRAESRSRRESVDGAGDCTESCNGHGNGPTDCRRRTVQSGRQRRLHNSNWGCISGIDSGRRIHICGHDRGRAGCRALSRQLPV